MEALIAGAAAALIGVFAGRRLGSTRDIEVFSGRIGAIERLLGDNGISASLPDTLEQRMQARAESQASAAAKNAAALVTSTVQELITKVMDQRDQELIKVMEYRDQAVTDTVRVEIAEAVRGERLAREESLQVLASKADLEELGRRVLQRIKERSEQDHLDYRAIWQNLASKQDLLELQSNMPGQVNEAVRSATKDLISRSEVQEAFARVAQIEAQRINSERQAQEAAARQQAMRVQAVFGAPAMPPEMNTAINNQLAALNERLQQIGASMPAA